MNCYSSAQGFMPSPVHEKKCCEVKDYKGYYNTQGQFIHSEKIDKSPDITMQNKTMLEALL